MTTVPSHIVVNLLLTNVNWELIETGVLTLCYIWLSVSKSVSQSVNQQPTNQPTIGNRPTNQPTIQPTNQFIHSFNQSMQTQAESEHST